MKIDKNIPIPDSFRKKSENRKLIEKMKIGDSILIIDTHSSSIRAIFSNLGYGMLSKKETKSKRRFWRVE